MGLAETGTLLPQLGHEGSIASNEEVPGGNGGRGELAVMLVVVYSELVDHPWRVVTSSRRMCLSEEPDMTMGGLKSIAAIL